MDLILTKSISRFDRNTLDTIQYTRMLRAMGIGIYFEKENINTLDMDSEMLITMLGAFAQAESESISRNVASGKRKAIRDGKVSVNLNLLYGYYLREDGSPAFHSDKAEVVQYICHQFYNRFQRWSCEGYYGFDPPHAQAAGKCRNHFGRGETKDQGAECGV